MSSKPTRRSTLKALAGAVAAPSLLSRCQAPPAPFEAPSNDTALPPDGPAISTTVILMMENRTFDHYMGALSLVEGRDDVDGLRLEHVVPDADGEPVHPFHLDESCLRDPPHGWNSSHAQFNEGANDGFVRVHAGGRGEVASQAMGYLTREDLPVFYALADDNALCDRWFASVMGGTWPNRMYSLCGTSRGMRGNDFSRVPLEGPSIFDQLDQAGVSWKIYAFDAAWALLLDGLGGVDALGEHILPISRYYEDADAGRLPEVVFVEPGYLVNDDHPPHHPMLGQAFVGTIYDALAHGPHADGFLMVINYDEHGGFFDHVPPPKVPDEHAEDGFDQLGFRVPALVVGPYAKPGIVHTQFDHTSVLAHLQHRYGLPPLSERNAAAQDLHSCLDADRIATRTPRPPTSIPLITLTRDDVDDICFYAHVQGQPELAHCYDVGLAPAAGDFRPLAEAHLRLVLARAEARGILRITPSAGA